MRRFFAYLIATIYVLVPPTVFITWSCVAGWITYSHGQVDYVGCVFCAIACTILTWIFLFVCYIAICIVGDSIRKELNW